MAKKVGVLNIRLDQTHTTRDNIEDEDKKFKEDKHQVSIEEHL
jgi:hypothetical protein